ncbi:MAG: hypothetical protein QOI78_5152, partial [Actinomycetota bacterium]|nr:hypothetical protein [Actinomycetota bacterium]
MAQLTRTHARAGETTLLARSLREADAFAAFYTAYVARVSAYFVRRVFD